MHFANFFFLNHVLTFFYIFAVALRVYSLLHYKKKLLFVAVQNKKWNRISCLNK
jgi:hypothetical protein